MQRRQLYTDEQMCSILGIKLNPLNAELNPICHLLTLLGAHHILHVSALRVEDKVLPVTGHKGPEGKWRYYSTLF